MSDQRFGSEYMTDWILSDWSFYSVRVHAVIHGKYLKENWAIKHTTKNQLLEGWVFFLSILQQKQKKSFVSSQAFL